MVCKNMAKYLGRKETIKELAKQLSTLCGVPLLLILYGPNTPPNEPETWCSESDYRIVIDKYYEKTRNKGAKVKPGNKKVKKRNKEVKPGNSEVKKVGDDRFLGKLSLDELKNLNGFLAGKIECVKQRIDGLKGGKGSGNSFKSRDFEGGFGGELGNFENSNNLSDYDGKFYRFDEVEVNHMQINPSFNYLANYGSGNLIDFGEGKYCFDEVEVNHMQINPSFNYLANYGSGNLINFGEEKYCFDEVLTPIQTVYPSFNSDCNIDYKDGLNIGDLGGEFGFSNPLCTSSLDGCEDNELMVDISDLDNIKFVEDDLDVINRLATVDDGAFATELSY